MKFHKKENRSVNELRFELKYCERCGGLWLRPVGGGQIYCVSCGSEMAQLPQPSRKLETTKVPQGPQWGVDDSGLDGYEEGDGLGVGGVA
jgi:hypothetical protein